MRKTKENIEKLARDIVESFNFDSLIEHEITLLKNDLYNLTEEEFLEEWINFYDEWLNLSF